MRNDPWRILATLVLFGLSFGYVEAAVVVYVRELYEPLVLQFDPHRAAGDLFPLPTLEQLKATDSGHMRLAKIEFVREAGTIVMLALIGLAVGWNFNTRFAGFFVAFGVWDITYYIVLKALINWPSSLLEWDILFLVPIPWVGPVLAPVLVAAAMVFAGMLVLWRESTGQPVRISWLHWAVMVLGGLTIIAAFCWDFRHIIDGGVPQRFHWPIFFAGETIGLASFFHALRASVPQAP